MFVCLFIDCYQTLALDSKWFWDKILYPRLCCRSREVSPGLLLPWQQWRLRMLQARSGGAEVEIFHMVMGQNFGLGRHQRPFFFGCHDVPKLCKVGCSFSWAVWVNKYTLHCSAMFLEAIRYYKQEESELFGKFNPFQSHVFWWVILVIQGQFWSDPGLRRRLGPGLCAGHQVLGTVSLLQPPNFDRGNMQKYMEKYGRITVIIHWILMILGDTLFSNLPWNLVLDGMIWGLGSETLTQTFWVMPCGIFDISNHHGWRIRNCLGRGPAESGFQACSFLLSTRNWAQGFAYCRWPHTLQPDMAWWIPAPWPRKGVASGVLETDVKHFSWASSASTAPRICAFAQS